MAKEINKSTENELDRNKSIEKAFVEDAIPFPINVIVNIGKASYEAIKRSYNNIPRNCHARDDLYRIGTSMLNSPQSEVTAVSTIKDEDFPSHACASVAKEHIRDYFIALHRIAYVNMLTENSTVLKRYADLSDPDKCVEALSLLYYGKEVEITRSKVPVEFLTVDRKSILIGFPSKDKLFGGFHSYDKQQCSAMKSWIESHGAEKLEIIIESPVALANNLTHEEKQSHTDDCLCKIVDALGDIKPASVCANQFDHISSWYQWLYKDVEAENYYPNLSQNIRNCIAGNPRQISILDIGCAHAFGAKQFISNGFKYWGVDISPQMVKLAHSSGINDVYHCDALGAMMNIDHVDAKRFNANAPAKFDVIACQGNTFDFFLGPVQKALALFLFTKKLKPNGIIVFTGDAFTPSITAVKRTFNFPFSPTSIQYSFAWHGNYCKMIVKGDGDAYDSNLFLHPTNIDWLAPFLDRLGFDKIDLHTPWFGPGRAQSYYLWTFQKRSNIIQGENL